MTFDLQRVLASKRALRRKLAALPIAEKLSMLDRLREAALDIRKATFLTPDACAPAPETPAKHGDTDGE